MIKLAAIKYPDGDILTDLRHHKIIERAASYGVSSVKAEQGFVTSTGKFVNREQAKVIALRFKQIPKNHKGTLFSEDLWDKDGKAIPYVHAK